MVGVTDGIDGLLWPERAEHAPDWAEIPAINRLAPGCIINQHSERFPGVLGPTEMEVQGPRVEVLNALVYEANLHHESQGDPT